MSLFFLSRTLDSPATSSIVETGDHKHLSRMYESARFIPSTSHGYFWDIEEFRHQEHLYRVSHAQYLYRHRHDSNEAAKLYRSFMEEQNQWMDEQERLKEIESGLSIRAYQQRASRWEEEWRRLEEGRKVEDILKKTGAVLLTVPSFHRGLWDVSDNNDDLSDLIMTPQSISSLDLPGPLLSLPDPSCRLVFSGDSIQQVDGAQPSKGKKAHRNHRVIKPEALNHHNIDNSRKTIDTMTVSTCRIQPAGSRSTPIKMVHSGQEAIRGPRKGSQDYHDPRAQSPPAKRLTQRESSTGSSRVGSPSLGLNPSPYNTSPVTNSPHDQHERRHNPLTNCEVLRIISHKHWGNNTFMYLVSWKSHNSGRPPAECWARAIDFLEGEKKVILEEYHLRQNLGPVRWPRDSRRQWRSSSSFGVQEIKSALDERKQTLLERGAGEQEVIREMNEERWKMRDDWQRAGRGWGSAMMVVNGRKKAWSIADSDTMGDQLTLTSQVDDVTRKDNPGIDYSDHTAMMQAAGMIDLSNDQLVVERDISSPNEPPKASPGGISRPAGFRDPLVENEGRRSDFQGTSEDEREWREHFKLEPIISTSHIKNSGLSRVKSTLRNLPRAQNLELMRAATLPEVDQRVAKIQALLQDRYQEPAHILESASPEPTHSTISDAQSHLKTQRRDLLSRMLSHRNFRRGRHTVTVTGKSNGHSNLHGQPPGGIQDSIVFVETATEPLESPEGKPSGSHSAQLVTIRSSSYISFDGAHSAVESQTRKSWTKALWDRFLNLLVPSSRASISSGGNKKKRIISQSILRTPQLPQNGVETSPEVDAPGRGGGTESQVKAITKHETFEGDRGRHFGEATQSSVVFEDQDRHIKWQKQPMLVTGSSPSRLVMVETKASRTASWAASVLPPLRKSKSEEPRKGRWPPSDADQELGAVMVFAPSRTDTEIAQEPTDINQLSLEIWSGAESPSGYAGNSGNFYTSDKGKGKTTAGTDTPPSTKSTPLTRTRSQERYLAKRELEKQARRDKNVLRTKIKVRRRKEKADQYAEYLERLDKLRSRKSCPLSKWRKSDQLELELLRMKLGVRRGKGTWKKDALNNLAAADLQQLRESLLPTARAAKRQPKGLSPV